MMCKGSIVRSFFRESTDKKNGGVATREFWSALSTSNVSHTYNNFCDVFIISSKLVALEHLHDDVI